MLTYLTRHLQVLFATLGDIRRTPMASINTVLIIAIALLLPCLLFIAIKSAESLNTNWQGRPQITIFLQKDISESTAQALFQEIQLHPAIELAEFISPESALEEFRILSSQASDVSLEQELEFLGENPLPPSIVVMPDQSSAQTDKLLALRDELNTFDGIDTVRLDLEWTDRFNALLNVFTRVSVLLSALLAVGLIVIIGNTIKLLIFNRRHEIEITKLVGGTDTFVRRPFLYYGTLFGLFGALLTLVLLLVAGKTVDAPLNRLAELYQSSALLYQLRPVDMLAIVLGGSLIGWLAARWSVAQHLRDIQPR
ncbi:permease-like cell division protein FtsX [Arenicella xantha]|uniref:Cell division protein FtsX n=1 Tax=Arenicella xantha TaxID=644221 RepID=A0A395JSV5_9GAMM|nr:permease-like cell division protein FtsX [Arenicella xantha]RBP53422.1 cell division protein FtsX [Arenicella xantha]